MKTNDMVVQEIQNLHEWLIDATDCLTQSQFSHSLSPNAPPVGWHLWHIARFADRLAASFGGPSENLTKEIWEEDNLKEDWELDPARLGVLESGMEMEMAFAISFSELVGQDQILNYAKRCFERLDRVVLMLDTAHFDEERTSVRAYAYDGEKIVAAIPEQTTTGADLVFHVSHASEHLGSIEALIGALG